MKFKLIKSYWEIILLFLCFIVPLAQGWQFILIYRSPLELLVYVIGLINALFFSLIIGIYWVIELLRMLIYSLKKSKLKYSPVKTLIKVIGVPLLIFSYILFAVYTDTIRLKLSESALMNCVNNPNLCEYNTRIGWFYVMSIHQREGCTFFKTGIFMFSEFGIAYVPPGKEKCLYLRNDGSDEISNIYGNWWDYYYSDL